MSFTSKEDISIEKIANAVVCELIKRKRYIIKTDSLNNNNQKLLTAITKTGGSSKNSRTVIIKPDKSLQVKKGGIKKKQKIKKIPNHVIIEL